MSVAGWTAVEALGAFVAVCGGGLATALTWSQLYDVLRTRHPTLWEALGRPTIINSLSSIAARLRARPPSHGVLWFVVRGYRTVDDPILRGSIASGSRSGTS